MRLLIAGALLTTALTAQAQDKTHHYTGTGQNQDRASACAGARNQVSGWIAQGSTQRNTHHYNYHYSSSISDCTCSETPGTEKVEFCIAATAPNCVNNQRTVRTPNTWSCHANGVLTVTATPTK